MNYATGATDLVPLIELRRKYDQLLKLIADRGRVAVAFSGGVDSSFLCRAARDAVGDGVIAITFQVARPHSVSRAPSGTNTFTSAAAQGPARASFWST